MKLSREECLVGLGLHAGLQLVLEECLSECDDEDRPDYEAAVLALRNVEQRYRDRLKPPVDESGEVTR